MSLFTKYTGCSILDGTESASIYEPYAWVESIFKLKKILFHSVHRRLLTVGYIRSFIGRLFFRFSNRDWAEVLPLADEILKKYTSLGIVTILRRIPISQLLRYDGDVGAMTRLVMSRFQIRAMILVRIHRVLSDMFWWSIFPLDMTWFCINDTTIQGFALSTCIYFNFFEHTLQAQDDGKSTWLSSCLSVS